MSDGMTDMDNEAKWRPIKESPDMVNYPPHYTKGLVQCIDALEAALTPAELQGFLKANVIKYLWRMNDKGDAVENAQKAQWYLNRLVAILKHARP